jgi:hypothetical protein
MQPEMAPDGFLREIHFGTNGRIIEFALQPFLPTADAASGNNLSAATSLGRTE